MNEDTLLKCEGVSKRFCRSLKRSLFYGVQDIAKELRLGRSAAPNGTGKRPELRDGEFWAVDGVTFELNRGDCIGLIGHNGAGKTTLLKMLNGLIKPDVGRIRMKGRVGALIALGAGFNPILSGRENIYANGIIMGLTKREVDEKIEEIISFAEIENAIEAPVRTYSSGMQARLGFAVAAHLNPDILLIDEVLAVGDIAFRNKCLKFISGVRDRGGAIVLVTHSFSQVLSSCEKALLMHKGREIMFDESAKVIDKALELQLDQDARSNDYVKSDGRLAVNPESPASILDFSFKGVNGPEIVSGEPVLIEMKVAAKQEVEDCFWSFSIWTHDGATAVVSKISIDAGYSWKLKKGVTTFRAKTGPIWLPPRRYSVRVGLAASGVLLDLVGFDRERILITLVSRDKSKEAIRTTVQNELVLMDVKWEPDFDFESKDDDFLQNVTYTPDGGIKSDAGSQ